MKTNKKAVIIAGGDLDFDPGILIDENTLVIAADRGYDNAIKYGIIPHWVIGDFDSCTHEVLERTKKIVLSPNKDITDLEAALDLASMNDIDGLDILGALTGDREDHGYGAIQSLYRISKSINNARLVSKNGRTEVRFIIGPNNIQLRSNKGELFSLFSYLESVENLSIVGAKYCLDNAVLTNDSALCISNEFAESPVTVSFDRGILLCYLPTKNVPGGTL